MSTRSTSIRYTVQRVSLVEIGRSVGRVPTTIWLVPDAALAPTEPAEIYVEEVPATGAGVSRGKRQ